MLTRCEVAKKYRERHPDRVAKAKAAWAAKNPNYYRDKAAEYRRDRKPHLKAIRLKSRYKIPPTRVEPKRCECCNTKFTEVSRHHGACFDHCHATGEFRGWLCNDCNLALGYAKDSRKRLKLLIDYLDRHATK